MAANRPRGRQWYRYLIALGIGVVVLTALGIVATAPASGQVDAQLGSLSIGDVNQTVSGNVTDVNVDVTLEYDQTVPDASQRIIELKAGPSSSELETLTFVNHDNVAGDETGTVSLSASLLKASAFEAADFNPDYGGKTTHDIVIGATIEVRQADGDPVVTTVTEPVTITVHDDGEITASLGGSGDVTLETDA